MGRSVVLIVSLFVFAVLPAACSFAPVKRSSGGGEQAGTGTKSRATVHVTFREEPVPGVRVSWYESASGGVAPAAVGATDARGEGSFVIPPGKYFLTAQWRRGGDFARPLAPGDRFAWFGGNPVFLAPGTRVEVFVALEEVPEPLPPAEIPSGAGGVAGRVLAAGRPLSGAHVIAFLRADSGFRDLGFAASAPSDGAGGFALDLPPGRYYIVAKKRAAGGVAGPMRKGDYFGYYPGNPVTVSAGTMAPVAVPVTQLKLRNAPVYSGGYKAAAFIEGRIVGRDGKPRKGVYAALYDNLELLNRPVFLSDVTGGDGKYRLPVPVPGRYYLGARSGYGGPPAPGDYYGRYEGNAEHAVTVREGETLTGVDIVVDEVW